MNYIISLILSIYLFISPSQATEKEMSLNSLPLTDSQKNHILNDRTLVFSNMEDFESDELEEKGQSWNFSIYGLHPRSCRVALRRLSRYEEYSDHISFINSASYDEEREFVNFHLKSNLLPFSMYLAFNIPRIRSVGSYPYSFDRGFLQGLTGHIHVMEHESRCLFYSTATWQGENTGINNLVFEIFSRTLSKLAMETLFRISST